MWWADLKPTVPANEVPSGISSQSLLTPIGAALVLVKQRISRQAGKYTARKVMPSFSQTPEGVLRVSSEASSRPVVQPTTHVPLIVEFVHSGSSSFLFCAKVLAINGNGRRDANGELRTRICGSVAVKVACPSGQCYYPRLGLVVLCTSGQCILPEKRDCRFKKNYSCWDERACLRIVNLGSGAVVRKLHRPLPSSRTHQN